jgi:hypothetical protein
VSVRHAQIFDAKIGALLLAVQLLFAVCMPLGSVVSGERARSSARPPFNPPPPPR